VQAPAEHTNAQVCVKVHAPLLSQVSTSEPRHFVEAGLQLPEHDPLKQMNGHVSLVT